MSAPPARTGLADTYPNPSNATFRSAIGALWDTLFAPVGGLLGTTGTPADARNALGIGSAISFRNLVVNGNFSINQRMYASGAATTGANQVTLDRWRIVVSGENATFGAAAPDRTVTFPAGGGEEVIEAGWIVGGVYTLSWVGAGTATVNGAAITNGGQTASLPANTAVTLKFVGAVSLVQFELGTAATPFERRPPQVELALCQRDYAKSYAQGTAPGAVATLGSDQGYGLVGGGLSMKVTLPVVMRTAPTVSLWSNNGVANQWVAFTSAGAATSYAAASSNISDRNFTVGITPAASEVLLTGQWTAATGL
ncbi:hypothetical protein J2W30_003711 [Variovorax boronicumulans]|uniref:hypothetical protein n=1 Tax=Variovorax boronicumulans TaxID=436515 RepID=UPI00277F7456|nr:hypothetical protein [Variovorax boronicumulans]MDQ0035938.1 hypothetical protein [Variovorax boronicumulans]